MKPMVKNLGVIVLTGLLLLWSFIAGIERVLFYNTEYYPDSWINHQVSSNSNEQTKKFIQLACPSHQADLIARNGAIYVRCGLLWPASKVMKISVQQ